MSVTVEENPMSNFLFALRAPETKRQYPRRLKVLFDYLGLEGSLERQAGEFLARAATEGWVQHKLMEFIEYQKSRVERGEIVGSTINNYYKAAKLFIEMSIDTPIVNWKRLRRGLPRIRKTADDRAPTIEELRLMSEYPDRRMKAIVYIMASSGIRLGAWETLQWKHVEELKDNQKRVIAARLLIYPGDEEEYFAFITPEAYDALKGWMDYRQQHGERITPESWLMRDMWVTTANRHTLYSGNATEPKPLKSSGIKSLIERAFRAQGLWKPLPKGSRRREWKAAHGMRKFYKTRAEQVMRPINVEITMGHNIGVSGSYYRPTETEVLQDYVKAVDLLTISETSRLQTEAQSLRSSHENLLEQIADITRDVAALKSGKR